MSFPTAQPCGVSRSLSSRRENPQSEGIDSFPRPNCSLQRTSEHWKLVGSAKRNRFSAAEYSQRADPGCPDRSTAPECPRSSTDESLYATPPTALPPP